jgi:hypothetical protein
VVTLAAQGRCSAETVRAGFFDAIARPARDLNNATGTPTQAGFLVELPVSHA